MNKRSNLKGHLNFIQSFTFYPMFPLFRASAGVQTKLSNLHFKKKIVKQWAHIGISINIIQM